MNQNLNFKIEQFNRDWVKVYLNKVNYDLSEKNLETSNYCFNKVGILKEFDIISQSIKKYIDIKFKGDNIEDEFGIFYDLSKEIELSINKTKEWLQIFKDLIIVMEHGEDIQIFSEIRTNYIMGGNLDEFEQQFLEGLNISAQRILKLILKLEESSYILQYKLLVLYCLDKNISSYVLKDKVGFSNSEKKGVIISTFSSSSNYDIKKELYYNRRDIVNTVVSNKPKSYKQDKSLQSILINRENKNNYTINYKNIYDKDQEIMRSNPLLLKVMGLLDIICTNDLQSLERFYLEIESNNNDEELERSLELFMNCGFNRIVVVDSDNPSEEFVSRLINLLIQRKDQGDNLHESEIDLYKKNIELIKYVRNKNVGSLNSQVSMIFELLSHIKMLEKKSKEINDLKNFATQQLNIKNVFTVERVTLTCLAEKLRFLLYLDLTNDYKNDLILKLNNRVEEQMGKKLFNNYILNLFDNEISSERESIEQLKNNLKIIDKDLAVYFKQNVAEVNEYLSNSLFIWNGITWGEINKVFRENRLTLSSGLNNKKQFVDPLSYKLSVLLGNIVGRQGYKSVINSYHNTDSEFTRFKLEDNNNNIILEPKGFGKVHRVYALTKEDEYLLSNKKSLEENQSLLSESKSFDNVYEELLKRGPDSIIQNFIENKEEYAEVANKLRIKKKEEYKANKDGKTQSNQSFKRNYHTSVTRYNNNIESLSNIASQSRGIWSRSTCFNKKGKRFYSNNSVKIGSSAVEGDVQVINKDSIENDKNNHLTSLSAKFLNETSFFYNEIKELIDKELKSGTDLKILQSKIEQYSLDREEVFVYDKVYGRKNQGKFSEVLDNLDYYLKKIENILINFTHSYYINNYRKLITGMRNRDKSVNFFLLFFVIEAEVHRKKLLRITKIKESKWSGSKWGDTLINKKDNIKSIISIIISIISRILFKVKSTEDNESRWGVITQSNLINILGREIVKISPDEIPDIFFESDSAESAWTEEDKIFIKEYYTHKLYRESVEFQAEVGSTIFDILINNKNKINILKIDKTVTINKKKNIYITIADEFIEVFARKIYSPSKLPMVVAPAKWIDAKKNEGGYLELNYKNRVNSYLIHESFKNSGKSEIGLVQIDTVNYLNKQQFKINNDMLNLLLKEYFVTSSILYNGLNKQHPETIDKKLNSNVKKVLSHNSKFLLYNQVLSIAILFKNLSFYIPTFFDFRGRIYTEVDYFSYQAEDMAKSLIEFKNGCILDNSNIIYVLQALANLGGKSKLTIKNKEKWSIALINELNITKEELNYKNFNIDQIAFKEDFLKNFNIEFLIKNDYIKDIILKNNDDKLQFLSLLFNFINSLVDKNKKFCVPISFDATCSGFQHLSAMFKDEEMAKSSNVVNNTDIANDVYTIVGNNILNEINNLPDSPMKDKFLSINYIRKLVKKLVMVIPYNVGLEKMQQYLISMDFFEERIECYNLKEKHNIKFYIASKEICNENLQLSFSEFGKLTGLLYKAVYTTFPNLKGYVNYMKKFAVVLSNLDEPIEWITPVGMKINLKYLKRQSKPINSLFSKQRLGSISLPANMDSMANKIAFMPNFIHSMDSTNIQILIQNYKSKKEEDINLLTIHDCFATTPNFMKELNREVRLAFLMIYFQGDYIRSVHKHFITKIYKSTNIIYEEKNKTNLTVAEWLQDETIIETLSNPADKKTKKIKKEDLQEVKIKDINNIFDSLDVNKEYIVETGRNKFHTIPSLPYKVENWDQMKSFFEGVIESKYFIN